MGTEFLPVKEFSSLYGGQEFKRRIEVNLHSRRPGVTPLQACKRLKGKRTSADLLSKTVMNLRLERVSTTKCFSGRLSSLVLGLSLYFKFDTRSVLESYRFQELLVGKPCFF